MLRIILYGFALDDYLLMAKKLNGYGISIICAYDVNSKIKSILRLGDRKYIEIVDEPVIICNDLTPEDIKKLFSQTGGLIKFDGIIASVTPVNREWKLKRLIRTLRNEREAISKINILKEQLNHLNKIDISQASEEEIKYLEKWISKASSICKNNETDLKKINDVSNAISNILKNYHM